MLSDVEITIGYTLDIHPHQLQIDCFSTTKTHFEAVTVPEVQPHGKLVVTTQAETLLGPFVVEHCKSFSHTWALLAP